MSVSPSIRLLTFQRTRVFVAFALGTLVFFTYQSNIWPRQGKRDGNPLGVNDASSSNGSPDDDPQLLASRADHFYWLNNLSRAAPFYARAEKLFADNDDARHEIYAKVGHLRSDAETKSFDEPSHAGHGTQVTPHRAIS